MNMVNLLKMGLRLDEILTILSKQKYNKLLSIEASRILMELQEGAQFFETIQNDYYLPELQMLIEEGETHYTLIHNLENYIVYLEKNRAKKTKKLLFLIQPIFYGIFGILIIMLYMSIFMPMYQMMDSL